MSKREELELDVTPALLLLITPVDIDLKEDREKKKMKQQHLCQHPPTCLIIVRVQRLFIVFHCVELVIVRLDVVPCSEASYLLDKCFLIVLMTKKKKRNHHKVYFSDIVIKTKINKQGILPDVLGHTSSDPFVRPFARGLPVSLYAIHLKKKKNKKSSINHASFPLALPWLADPQIL